VIFADSDPKTLCLDVDDVKRRLRPDTRAVILVHIGGIIPRETYAVQTLCEERGMVLIEDCAHAHGCALDGKQAGAFGVAGAFSFFPTKVLVTGEGGMITTNDERVYRGALMIRNHGKNPDMGNRMSEIGHNQRLSEFTALLGVQQMQEAAAMLEERQRLAHLYDEALKGLKGVRPLALPDGLSSSYYKYIAYLDERYDRSQAKRLMKEKYGVSLTGEVYAELCHTEPVWDRYAYCGRRRDKGRVDCTRWPSCGCDQPQKDFPGAEYISLHHICLPLYRGLSEAEVAYVVESLQKTLSEIGGN
jgi:dTDP-4-amino-4,6-dideoxygalactose transaminase